MALAKLLILALGAAYPAYNTYKAMKSKNLKLYAKWMTYWIVFACFTCGEVFGDVFLGWFSLYYWCKIVFVLWLLSPVTRGSTILYRKLIRPLLKRKETEIDNYILQLKHAVWPFVCSSSTTSLNSCCSREEVLIPFKKPEARVEIREAREDKLLSNIMETALRWTSRETSEDANPLQIEVRVKYKSGTSKMLVKRNCDCDAKNKVLKCLQ